MDKFDVHAWKLQQLLKENDGSDDITDFIYDLRNKIQDFARSHNEDENMQLLKRLAELVKYYGGDINESIKEEQEKLTLGDLEFGVHVKKNDSLPVPNSDASRNILDAEDLASYLKRVDNSLEVIIDRSQPWFDVFKVPAFKKGRKDYAKGKMDYLDRERKAGRTSGLDEDDLDESKIDYDFSEEELIRVLRQLKRGASTEVDMIRAFTKALGREITDDELMREDDLDEEKKKADRCLRIARRKMPKSSAYRSGLIVQCRNGKIWKDLKG